MKYTVEEMTNLLNNSVAKALGSDKVEEKKEDNIAIKSLEAKVDTLVDFISKNVQVEKPKTMEEQMEDLKKSILDSIAEQNQEEVSEDEKPLENITAKSLKEMIVESVKDVIKDQIVSKGEPTGELTDEEQAVADFAKALGISVDAEDDEDAGEAESDEDAGEAPEKKKAAKSKNKEEVEVTTVEQFDDNGNEIPMAKRQAMQKLDNYLGKKLQFEFAKRGIATDKED